jgi:hypothetical protein
MRKIVGSMLWLAVAVAALFVIVTAIGLALPKDHVVSRTLTLPRHSPPEIYAVITDFPSGPKWRPGLVKVEKTASRLGLDTWKETYSSGDSLSLRTTSFSTPNYLVREVADRNGPFSGRWEYSIQRTENGGSTVKITEYGTVSNPFFRFMSKYVLGQTSEIDKFLSALAKRLEEPASIS